MFLRPYLWFYEAVSVCLCICLHMYALRALTGFGPYTRIYPCTWAYVYNRACLCLRVRVRPLMCVTVSVCVCAFVRLSACVCDRACMLACLGICLCEGASLYLWPCAYRLSVRSYLSVCFSFWLPILHILPICLSSLPVFNLQADFANTIQVNSTTYVSAFATFHPFLNGWLVINGTVRFHTTTRLRSNLNFPLRIA